ncbi:MAG: PspC domain-containing protein [bacterium]|jgi:phage shock protein PspC (stress-responsive transcriptional regulator)
MFGVLTETRRRKLAGPKKIFKVREGRIIDGVCGGAAAYAGIDPLWVRIAWAALALAGGIGVLAYLLGMYLFPRGEGRVEVRAAPRRGTGFLISGIILVCIGAVIVLRFVGVMTFSIWDPWGVAFSVLWPLCLIGGGGFLIYMYWRETSGQRTPFRRSTEDRMILGVCGGLGEYFNVDPNIVRFVLALFIILSRGIGLIVYLLIALLMPQADREEEL